MHLMVNTEGGGVGSCLSVMLKNIVEELSVDEIKTINSLEIKHKDGAEKEVLDNVRELIHDAQSRLAQGSEEQIEDIKYDLIAAIKQIPCLSGNFLEWAKKKAAPNLLKGLQAWQESQSNLSNIMDYFEPRRINSDAVKSIECTLNGAPEIDFGDLNSDNFLPLYKDILKKLKFKEALLDRVPKDISKFLGVHIRLTDFNFYHGEQHGHLTLENYVTCVKKILKDGNYDGLFVSSDNAESIPSMEQHFPDIDIIYNKSKNCWCGSEETYLGVAERNQKRRCFQSADFIVETFVDMVSLSRCKSIAIRQKTGFGALAHLWSTHNQGLYYVE